jgi:predicted RNA-binding protein with PUA-like domain
MNRWLVKSEPSVYAWSQFCAEKRTFWNGVRNHQAKNNLMKMKKGDLVLVYHSQGPKSVAGIAKVAKEHYPDTHIKADDPKGAWVMVDIEAVKRLPVEVTLEQIKKDKALHAIALIKQSRLSVMPLTDKEYARILELGGAAK